MRRDDEGRLDGPAPTIRLEPGQLLDPLDADHGREFG